jgi:myosin-5
MKTLNLKGAEREAYWRIIAAVLHLSQIKFDDSNYNGSNACEIVSKEAVENLCHVLQVDKEMIEGALTTRTPVVMGKEVMVYLDKNACTSQTEAFAKDIYSKLFNWVIKYLNIALLPEPEQLSGKNPAEIYKKIGLLDIFGFEIFDLNSIEQLCINFTNEKLHQLYVEYVFKLEVQTFINEGLKEFLANLSFKDNQEVIDTLSHNDTKKFAIFNLIDDQAATMSKDMNLIDQFKQLHAKNPKVAFNKTKNNFFLIVHTARAVGYTIDGFCEKNKDEVPRPIIKCLLASRIPQIVDIYNQKVRPTDQPVDYLSEATKKKESFIGYKFRQQMEALMTELRSCQCSFMRCIKPNEVKSATVWTSNLVVLQIRYLGLLDSIRIRKESYPFRFGFRQFVNKYLELEPSHSSLTPSELEQLDPNYAELSRNILFNALPAHTDKTQLIGKTRVFLKIEAFQELEQVYENAVKSKKHAICSLDKLLLEVKLRNRILDTRQKGFVACDILKLLLTDIKAKANVKQFKVIRKAAVRLQAWFRKMAAQRKYLAKRKALMTVQQGIAAFLAHVQLRERQKAAKHVYRYWRNAKLVSNLKFYVEILRKVRQIAYNAVTTSMRKQQEKAVITIQSFYRGHLCRRRHPVEVQKIKQARENFRYQKAMKTMKRYIGGRVVRLRVRKVMKAASIIQAYFKMIWTRHAYLNMKAKTIILQRAMRKYLVAKRERDAKKLQYLKEEYIPFLRRCRADQAKLFDMPEDTDTSKETTGREVKPLKKKPTKVFEQIPQVDSSLVQRARILTEVIDLEFIEDVLPAYQGSWAAGYIDSCQDTRKNKSECRVIEVGRNHTVLATSHGRCYTWGKNTEYQLGCENEHDTMAVFRVLKGEEKLKYVAVGEDCSHLLTREGTVFSFGSNDRGQLGLGNTKLTNQIELNTTLTNAKLRSLHCKGDQSYAVSEQGEVLFWPVGPADPRVGFLMMPASEKINTISLGLDFGILLTESGQIYSFGTRNEFGQLGLGHFEPSMSPNLVKFGNKERVMSISTGKAHAVCVTRTHRVFAWGEGSQGQLGTGDCQSYSYPIPLTLSSSSKVLQVCCSYYGSYALVEDGVVFWWGRNSRIRQLNQPTVFRTLTNIELYPLQIRSSWSSTMSVTYLEIADLRYVKEISSSLKNGYAKQMASRWNYMGNSQCKQDLSS